MTEELQQALDRELDEAVESGDPVRIMRSLAHGLKALMDCQRKTADRVKTIIAQRDATLNQMHGAKWLWDAIKVVAGAGGGAIVLKLIGG